MTDRRTTIKWVLAAGATWPLLGRHGARAGAAAVRTDAAAARGYGTDPDLLAVYRPGQVWPLTLTVDQRRLAGILADIIIPADEHSPGASAVGVAEFIDEWISAPYPDHRRDRASVLAGFAWLDAEAERRFGKKFPELDRGEQHLICADICDEALAGEPRREAARFFTVYRDLTAGAFYSTAAGRRDLRYIGNVPLTRFDGPPPDLLESLGLP